MPAISRTSLRILVVQDEPITRELLAHLLRMGGYEVLCADTGGHALMTMRKWRGRIDCLFTGIKLPGLVDGWILADEFRVSNPLRPIIYASENDADYRRRMPDTAFVRAPVSPIEVLERVKLMTEPVFEADSPASSEPLPVLMAS
jgi:CheY-like chemotaxis protein